MNRLPSLLLACLYVTTLVVAAFAQSDPAADLAQLETLLDRRKSTVGDLVTYVGIAKSAHLEAADDVPETEPLRRDLEDALVRALTAVRLKPAPRGADTENLLEEVNVAAARALSEIAPTLDAKTRKSLAKRIGRAIDGLHDARRYEPSAERIDATFVALARMGTEDTLAGLLDDYSHTKAGESAFLVAAHKAMILFEDVPGRLRFEVVKRFKERYAGLESTARKSSSSPADMAAKRLWDEIRLHTILVIQTYAGFPLNDQGNALATVGAFQDWFRDHKDARRAPWVDAP